MTGKNEVEWTTKTECLVPDQLIWHLGINIIDELDWAEFERHIYVLGETGNKSVFWLILGLKEKTLGRRDLNFCTHSTPQLGTWQRRREKVFGHHHHHHHHYQLLDRDGRLGTTNDFATSFLHFPLFSTTLWDLPNSRPVHSLMLSSHLLLCLPCFLPPFT